MVRNKHVAGKVIFCLVFIVVSQIVVFAAETWSNPGTFNLPRGGSWNRVTTTGVHLGNTKTTTSTNFEQYTISKTVSSSPSFRLVNSSNEVRSKTITTAAVGRQKTGGGNTGEKGYAYYASVKPALNQITGSGSIRLQFKSK